MGFLVPKKRFWLQKKSRQNFCNLWIQNVFANFEFKSLSTTPSTLRTSLPGKRAGPANDHVGNNKKKHKPPPPTPPVRALQGLTLNIRGMTPAKWVAIQELPAFSSLDYIILTEHQLSAEFRPDEIIKSGWDFHAVSGTVTTLPQRGYQGQRYRGGLALLTRNSMRFSITMHSLSGAVNTILGDNCASLTHEVVSTVVEPHPPSTRLLHGPCRHYSTMIQSTWLSSPTHVSENQTHTLFSITISSPNATHFSFARAKFFKMSFLLQLPITCPSTFT